MTDAAPYFANGWLYYSPDSGLEWSQQHPIESGEVPDAHSVRRPCADELLSLMIEAWADLRDREVECDKVRAELEKVSTDAGKDLLALNRRAETAESRLTKLIEAARPLIARLDGHNGGISVQGASIIQELLALERALKAAVDAAVKGEGEP